MKPGRSRDDIDVKILVQEVSVAGFQGSMNVTLSRILVAMALAPCMGCADNYEGGRESLPTFRVDSFEIEELGSVFRRVPLDHDIDGVSELFLSETEITNAMFQAYINDSKKTKNDVAEYDPSRESNSTSDPVITVHYTDSLWRESRCPSGRAEHPVAFVTMQQAMGFAYWLNLRFLRNGTFRLPLEQEWLWAAYGRDRKYPWGNAGHRLPYGRTTPVKSFPDLRTPDGLFGMWGNVSELVHTRSDGYGGRSDTHIARPIITQWLGESFAGPAFGAKTVQARQDYWGYNHSTLSRGDHLGFRVAFIPN